MSNLEYTTVEQQIEKLKSQKLLILNEENAKTDLMAFGYTNLIKGYREPYIVNFNGQKMYRSGVTFEQICSLYIFDKNLRNAVMASMLELEEHIKETAADIVAKSFGTHQDHYLMYRHYQNKTKKKYRFSLPGILDTLKNTLNTDKEPILHYMKSYGTVPPWILFKSVYFSTITNFIDLFKSPEKLQMTKRLYSQNEFNLPPESLIKLMMDTLYICLDYRNIAAHGGRVYNYNSNRRLRLKEIFGDSANYSMRGFSILLFLLGLFSYKSPYYRLESSLRTELTRHCNHFPQDATYLGQIMNMNIVSTRMAYITEKSNKYHFNPYCSGIKNAVEIPYEDAEKEGYIPCRRCVHQNTFNNIP